MKNLLLILAICFCTIVNAQSPALMVNVAMDSLLTGRIQYKIEMKICEPLKGSAVNGYFNNDRSPINFKVLTEKDISCGTYMENGEGKYKFYNFRYSNRVFAWEKILIWKIMNWSSRGWNMPMYIILPVKIKSFATSISINNFEFQSDKVVWLDDEGTIDNNHTLQINVNLKGINGIDTDNCTLQKILN